jgi:hypothetical protein
MLASKPAEVRETVGSIAPLVYGPVPHVHTGIRDRSPTNGTPETNMYRWYPMLMLPGRRREVHVAAFQQLAAQMELAKARHEEDKDRSADKHHCTESPLPCATLAVHA